MNLYYNTISPLLWEVLQKLMATPDLNDFILVGGTALALQLGHRESIDIDLFTAQGYGSIDFLKIKETLTKLFDYSDGLDAMNERGLGYSVYLGNSPLQKIKVDMFYTEEFIKPCIEKDNLRLASLEDISGMKMLAITSRKQRKDFWDIYELLNCFSFEEMLNFGLQRNPYSLEKEDILQAFNHLEQIELRTQINCFKGNYWELIAQDLQAIVEQFRQNQLS
ncbi:MAG: nucleotidyl transferase AbiEii/AbiGii toxin family protein [Dysgonamonadaceae bacterium]|jgi:predicted nucleotidyltransferase component of viral defense system|nr:nucleotidyl transferase AbiEii/AbiGii toxin family protein [Dysgonamonadaceae bacterium]